MKSKWINILLLSVLCGFGPFISTVKAIEKSEEKLSGQDPNTIRFFIYVLDIDNIDGAEQNFAANVFIRLNWKDVRLADSGDKIRFIPIEEIWHPRYLITNQFGLVRPSFDDLAEVDSEGNVMYRQRYVGLFSQPLRLDNFPFDKHDFTIHFIFPGYLPDEIRFIADPAGHSTEHRKVIGGDMAEKLSLPDWKILKSSAQSSPYEVGDTGIYRAGISFVFTARRYFIFYFWQAIVPMVLILIMSWAAFWINPTEAGPQLGLAASSMFTLIAHRLVMTNYLPKLPYMTRLDYFSILIMIMVFMALIEVVITSILAYHEHLEKAKKIDRFSRVLFPVLFVLIIAWSFFG